MATKKNNKTPRILNRKARHNYEILESLEVGIMLKGCEVKSARDGQVSLAEGFARIDAKTAEIFLHNVHIAPYVHAGETGLDPDRQRKLLAHKREINKLITLTSSKGATLVPLTFYFKNGRAKIELGVGVGKKQFDKRQDLRKREAKRDMQRAMTRKRL
jgi:SsrA-binding protein